MTIGFGIIGLDHWYNAFPMMDAIRAHSGAELIAIAHRDNRQAAETAARYQPVELASIDAILADPRVDAVCTFTSTDENAAASVRALDAGKHVIAIKPMAMTLAEADAVVEAAARSGKHYLPGDQFRRFTPANVQIKRWVEEDRIGGLLAAHCLFRAGLPQAWPGASEPGWFADPTRSPGGAFIDHAIYHVDVLRWLLGAEVNAVTAVTANVRHHPIAVEDWGHAVLSFRNGKMGTIEDTWTSGPGASKEAIEVIGSKGSITWDTASNRIWLDGGFGLDGWVQVNPPRGGAGFFGHAIDVLSGKAEPVSSAAGARANLAACLAIYESARTGCEVKLPLMDDSFVIAVRRLVTGAGVLDRSAMLIQDGTIYAVVRSPHRFGKEPPGWLRAEIVMPGFIDMHTHGFGGHGFGDGPEAAREAARLLARAGVTTCYATLGQGSSIVAIARSLEGAAAVVDQPTGGARIAGLALEGPFISVAKRGAWPPANLRTPDISELRELIAAAAGTLRRVNVAPELPGALDFIRYARKRSLIVSLGHSDATAEQARAGAEAGATITNHTFNGMSGLHHRAPGLAGETMANPALLAELILDGVHVHPTAAKALFAAKGRRGLAIITDNTTSAGLPDGTYGPESRPVTVRDGEVRLPDGTLAGSASRFDRNLRNAAAWLTDDLQTLAAITSTNAARAMHISRDTGDIIEGHRADLVLLDRDLQVQATIVGGEIVYRRAPLEVVR